MKHSRIVPVGALAATHGFGISTGSAAAARQAGPTDARALKSKD